MVEDAVGQAFLTVQQLAVAVLHSYIECAWLFWEPNQFPSLVVLLKDGVGQKVLPAHGQNSSFALQQGTSHRNFETYAVFLAEMTANSM